MNPSSVGSSFSHSLVVKKEFKRKLTNKQKKIIITVLACMTVHVDKDLEVHSVFIAHSLALLVLYCHPFLHQM